MKRKETQSIGNILDEILQTQGLNIGLDSARVRQAWQETMGEAVVRYTEQISLEKDTLYVRLSSSILRNELFMCRSQIMQKLNDKIGRQVIQTIIFK